MHGTRGHDRHGAGRRPAARRRQPTTATRQAATRRRRRRRRRLGGGGGGGGTDPGGSPTQPGSTSIKFARKQTGTTLRGSVTAAAGAKIVVTALVSNRYLSTSRPKKVKKVSVGSQTKRSTGAKVSFAVKLSKAARKALKSRDKLSVTLRIVVTPSGGKATTKTVAVKLSAD